jgi:ABC-type uncharacterized transport system permease subunit
MYVFMVALLSPLMCGFSSLLFGEFRFGNRELESFPLGKFSFLVPVAFAPNGFCP